MFNDFLAMKLATLTTLLRSLSRLGPYLAIELVLPGGSIIAALLWLLHHKQGKA